MAFALDLGYWFGMDDRKPTGTIGPVQYWLTVAFIGVAIMLAGYLFLMDGFPMWEGP